ncbi:MAG: hypothetical protein QXL13_02015 [Nitrososphaerota archaeon]
MIEMTMSDASFVNSRVVEFYTKTDNLSSLTLLGKFVYDLTLNINYLRCYG